MSLYEECPECYFEDLSVCVCKDRLNRQECSWCGWTGDPYTPEQRVVRTSKNISVGFGCCSERRTDSMKTRVVVFVIAVVLCLGFNSFFALSVDPTVAANLAVNQLADDEISAVAMRNYGHYSNMIETLSWGVVIVLGIGLFWGDVVTGIKKFDSFIKETEGK